MANADSIFLIQEGKLSALSPQPYDAEDILQQLLVDYPAVLAGHATVADADAARLLLVRREMGVPAAAGAGATWSLDHLFLDADGVPVIVEVKRSSDTRIRREVVGQMLDYAANGVRYWPIDDLRAALDATMKSQGRGGGDEALRELRPDLDPEQYWAQVRGNLDSGRIRMVFVADRLPPELIRIIEFLNEQMRNADVLGVEVPQYVGPGAQVLVPRLVGRTATAEETKTAGTAWTEESFLTAAAERCSEAEVAFLRDLLQHAKTYGVKLSWGKAATPGVSGWYAIDGESLAVWTANVNTPAANTRAYAYFWLSELAKRLPGRIETFAQSLAAIPSFAPKIADAKAADWRKSPSIYLPDLLATLEGPQTFLAALDGLLGQEA